MSRICLKNSIFIILIKFRILFGIIPKNIFYPGPSDRGPCHCFPPPSKIPQFSVPFSISPSNSKSQTMKGSFETPENKTKDLPPTKAHETSTLIPKILCYAEHFVNQIEQSNGSRVEGALKIWGSVHNNHQPPQRTLEMN